MLNIFCKLKVHFPFLTITITTYDDNNNDENNNNNNNFY
jgi:hypothetical protein